MAIAYRRSTSALTLYICFVSLPIAQAEIVTDGDAFFDDKILVATVDGDGSFTITGPTVLEGAGINVASIENTTGNVVIDGGTYISTDDLDIGYHGSGSLEVINGGTINGGTNADSSKNLFVSPSSSVSINGQGSRLDMPESSVRITNSAQGARFTIEGGGFASHKYINIGTNSYGPATSIATVTGAGSRWEHNTDLGVGWGGKGELWIQDGGRVVKTPYIPDVCPYDCNEFQRAVIGGNEGTGLVVVEGPGSHLALLNDLTQVGYASGTGTLKIRDGGSAVSNDLYVGAIGSLDENSNGLITIDGIGSELNINRRLLMGLNGTAEVQVTNGGTLASSIYSDSDDEPSATVGFNNYSRIIVDGPQSQWIDEGHISLGRSTGGFGELRIQNGASVTHSKVSLGGIENSETSNGGRGEVYLSGQGSRWNVERLNVGQAGKGKVEITDKAVLNVSPFGGNILVGPEGEIELNDGEINYVGQLLNEGVISGSGGIDTIILFNYGDLRVNQNDRLVISGNLSNNQGDVDINSGELEVVGINNEYGRVSVFNGELRVNEYLTNYHGATISLENSTLFAPVSLPTSAIRGFYNEGNLVSSYGFNRIFETVNNLEDGRIILSGNSQTTFYDDVINYGTFNVSTGSVATLFGDLHGNGIVGGGTVFLEGDVFPGFSPGEMGFNADVVLGFASSLTMEAFGDQPGTEYDMLSIEGEATLGGELLLDIQAPLGDVTLTLLEADSISGTFDTVPELYSHVGHGMFLTEIIYSENSVSVSLVEGLADFDHDDDVDDADLDILFANYGSNSSEADANGDGTVSGSDFLTWARKFGSGSSIPAAATQVPEPSGILISMLSMICLASQRKAIGR